MTGHDDGVMLNGNGYDGMKVEVFLIFVVLGM